jgi:ubiquinone/menaquinone biosynthesis C-methylase UbiE
MTDSDEYSEFASQYDSMIERFQCFADAAVFGLMYDHVKPGEKVLDIGIGTGLASERLARYGLRVYGVDASQAMLTECQKKGTTKEIRLVDVSREPLPYENAYFEHVLTCGLLHFFEDLDDLFRETVRVMRDRGTFTFTVMADRDGGPEGRTVLGRMTKWGRQVFHQGRGYISDLCRQNGLTLVSWLLVLGDVDPEDGAKNYYWIYVTRKECG